ncbi:MAG TPA: hypothetical protein VNQ77_18045 [Frankiaceae bacterium]|nr:hypothetical protein [Frankiaceae bacterium]
MSNELRTVLHDLAPEPPHGLGEVAAARRRARALRRRQRYGAASVVTLSLVALFGYTVVSRPAPVEPAAPLEGSYLSWPRRGDGPRSLDRAAIRAWDRSLDEGVRRYGDARVLYASGGERPVVVLYAVATRGGERLVVVTGSADRLEVHSDTYAPDPRTQALAVLVDRPPPGHFGDVDCAADPLTDPSSPARLLALTAPGATTAAWSAAVQYDPECPGDDKRTRAPVPLPLTDGAALVPTRLGPRARVQVRFDGNLYSQYVVDYPGHVDAQALRIGGGPADPYGWTYRHDGSRADDLWETVYRAQEIQRDYDSTCAPFWYGSLPDGTGAVLCVTATVKGQRTVILAAERADRRVAIYLEQKAHPAPTALAAVVDGLDGRWLVVVGSDELTSLSLVDRGERTPIPMRNGAGFLRMDREPSDEAYLTNSEYAAGGGFAIQDRVGRVLARRY